MPEETVTLYRPTGEAELALVKASGMRRWPPRLPEQPIFYAVTNQEYAEQIARQWNATQGKIGFVTCFSVHKSFMDRYEIHQVGAAVHTEWWIPAEDVEAMNDNIIGLVEITGEYKPDI